MDESVTELIAALNEERLRLWALDENSDEYSQQEDVIRELRERLAEALTDGNRRLDW